MQSRLGDKFRSTRTLRLDRTDRAILSRGFVTYTRMSIWWVAHALKIPHSEPLQIQMGPNPRRMAAILITGLVCEDLHVGLSTLLWDNDTWQIPCWFVTAEAPMTGFINWAPDDMIVCWTEDISPPRFSCPEAEGWGEVDRLWDLLNVFLNHFPGFKNPFEGSLGVCDCPSVMLRAKDNKGWVCHRTTSISPLTTEFSQMWCDLLVTISTCQPWRSGLGRKIGHSKGSRTQRETKSAQNICKPSELLLDRTWQLMTGFFSAAFISSFLLLSDYPTSLVLSS